MRSVWLTANSHTYVRSGSQPTKMAPSQDGSQPRWLPAKSFERSDTSHLSISRNDKKCPLDAGSVRGMRIFRLRECGAGAWRGGDVGYDSRSMEEMQMGGRVYVTSVCLRVCSYVCVLQL